MKKGISLSINTLVLVILAVIVFAFGILMLMSSQKTFIPVMGISEKYVSNPAQLYQAREQCKLFCQWAKNLDFLNSQYCTQQISLTIIDPQTGKKENKLFYCWQSPINVNCDYLADIYGEGIVYFYVSNGCKKVEVDYNKLNDLENAIVNYVLNSNIKYWLNEKSDET